MGAIIWIIVIIIFIFSIFRNSAAGKSKKGSSAAKPSGTADSSMQQSGEPSFYRKQAKPNQPKPGMKTAKPNQPKPGMKTAKPNKPKPGMKTAKPNKPKPKTVQAKPNVPTGDPAVTRYSSYGRAKQDNPGAPSAMHQLCADDILESARENSQAVQLDNDMDMIEIGDLMAKVQDTIVMGPVATLSFQRDFVAEGMDLLNRYTTIPGTEAGSCL